MKKTTWFLRLAGFGRCRSGAAALEMGLLAPLLVLMLAVIIEVGRGWLSYDRFMTIVDDSARWAARFPEFEERVRTGVPSFVVLSGSGILQKRQTGGQSRPAAISRPQFSGICRRCALGENRDRQRFCRSGRYHCCLWAVQLSASDRCGGRYHAQIRICCGRQPVLFPAISLPERQIGFRKVEPQALAIQTELIRLRQPLSRPGFRRATPHNPAMPALQ